MFKESHSQNIYEWGQGRSGHLARSQDLTKPTSDDEVPLFSDRKSCTQQLPWESALSPGTQGLKEEQWEELEGFIFGTLIFLAFRLPFWTPMALPSLVSPKHSVPSFCKPSCQLAVSHSNLDSLVSIPDISQNMQHV